MSVETKDKRRSVSPAVANGIAIVVTLVWAVSFVADIIPSANYDPPTAIHAAFMVVVGSIFGVQLFSRDKE